MSKNADCLQNLPCYAVARGQRAGVFRGSEIDRRDGFIHFSTAAQAVETAAKHFAGQRDLLLLYVDTATLGDKLKWEPSRGGALFPHLYGDLPLAAVTRSNRCRSAPIMLINSRHSAIIWPV